MGFRSLLQASSVIVIALGCCVMIACGSGGSPAPSSTTIAATQNPLVAQYSLSSACAGKAMVEFGPDTNYGRMTSWYPTPGAIGGSTVNILVAGMKASTVYHMRSQFECFGTTYTSSDQTFKTGPLPKAPFPTLQVSRPNPNLLSQENPGIEEINMLDGSGQSGMMQALFTDRDANTIWYYDVGVAQGNFPYTFKILPNGHVLFSISKSVTSGTVLREVDLAGNTIRELDTATLGQRMQQAGYDFVIGGFHHDFLPLDNGHVIVLGNFYKNFTNLPGYPGTTAVLGDGLVDLDENWNPVWAWNSFDHLDVNRHLNGLPDWTHANAVIYSPVDGNILLSMRHQSWVLKIDYNNGQGAGDIMWKLGYQGDFSLPTGDDPSQWFSFQHFPSLITQSGSSTTLAVWDNGDNRVIDSNGDICTPGGSNPCFSRASVYQLDESTKSATLQWGDEPGYYSVWGGSINQLPNQNIEFDANAPGFQTFASQVQEVTQTTPSQIVWEMTMNTLPVYAYRAYRVPSLYPGVAWTY